MSSSARYQRIGLIAALLLLGGGLGGCVASVGPVEAVRFVAEDRRAALGQGVIAVVAAEGADSASLELTSYRVAVERELSAIGYTVARPGDPPVPGAQRAEVTVERNVRPALGRRGPVSVGVGAGSVPGGTGVGLGIGLDLSPRPKDQIVTELRLVIRDSAGDALWEGRASVEARAGSPMAGSALNAGKLAAALFQDFPGESGATISVP